MSQISHSGNLPKRGIMLATADRLAHTQEYYFSKKLREIAQMNTDNKPIINLGIGSPDLPPPPAVIITLSKYAEQSSVHGYQSYRSSPQLRTAFANWYKKHYQVGLNSETEILPLMGSKEGIMHISMTYLNPGDKVLVPNPGYPAYKAATQLAQAEVMHYNLDEANDWLPDIADLENQDLSKVKIMWVNYPHMPTGAQASRDFFDQLIAFGERNKILVCNDNPYSFILNENPISLLNGRTSPYALELNSISKSHNMAGWRIGMITADAQHIDNILRFKSNMDSGMFLPLQLAAAEALAIGDNWYKTLNTEYKERQCLVFELLDELGFTYDSNQTGMFVWAKAPENIINVTEWADQLLKEHHLFITPGFIFGDQGERYIRVSLCKNQKEIKIAIQRIKENRL